MIYDIECELSTCKPKRLFYCFLLRGSNSTLKRRYVIITAHFPWSERMLWRKRKIYIFNSIPSGPNIHSFSKIYWVLTMCQALYSGYQDTTVDKRGKGRIITEPEHQSFISLTPVRFSVYWWSFLNLFLLELAEEWFLKILSLLHFSWHSSMKRCFTYPYG